MEQIRTTSSRFKRKPLSDRTNTPQIHPYSNLISQTLIKPPKKPSNLALVTRNTTNHKKNRNPNFNLISNVVVSNSSVKSGTSTGSNNSPNSITVQSQPDDIVCRKSGPPVTLTQRHGEQIRKEKGKSVGDTPIIEASAYLAPQAVHTSSSTLSGNGGHISRPPTVENCEKDEQKRKDKGKAVLLETPIIPISTPLTSHTFPTSSSAASGNCFLPLPSWVDVHKQDARALKGDTVPVGPTTPSLVSSSSVSGDIVCRKSGPSATLTQRQGEQSRRDKGTSVSTTPIVQATAYLTSRAVGGHVSRPPVVENHEVNEQKRKDKGKAVVETATIHISTPLTSHTLPTSSSAASGTCYLLGPSVVRNHKQDAQAKKDNVVVYGPTTPCSLTSLTSSSVSGTYVKEKTGLIVYNQIRPSRRSSRRSSQTKNDAGSISLPFSCPPERRTKKKGVEIDNGGRDGFSGSHTDPLPLHKKKRARNQQHEFVHAMPQDEVQRLKALYADIDAFELVEEVAAETELD